MASHSDLELLKEIPGYKAILKSVLKSQIQLLIEQLADHTGEESIILTASVNDGALSHLGSSTGKGFLEGRDEIKSQFLGYCLKTHHKRRSDQNSSPYAHDNKTLIPASKRTRVRQMPYPTSPPANHYSHITSPTSRASRSASSDVTSYSHHQNSALNLAATSSGQDMGVNQSDNFLDNLSSLSRSQTGSSRDQSDADAFSNSGQQQEAGVGGEENGPLSLVKSEPGAEEDGDLELTGVEVGDNSVSSETWSQGYASKDENNAEGDQSGYNSSEQAQNGPLSASAPAPVRRRASEPLGGIAFPGLDNARHDFSATSADRGNRFPDISPSELKHALYPEGTDMYQKDNTIFFASNSEEYNRMKTHYQDTLAAALSPRKRGRPRKHIISAQEALDQINSLNALASDDPESFPDSFQAKIKGRRGRPRKELESLPAGFVRPAGISLGNGYVKCNICGKILKSTSMFTHKQAHLGIKKYSCEFCSKSFTQKGPLITHRRIHTGEKPYNCATCGKPFAAQSGLYQHSRRCPRALVPDPASYNHNITL